MLIGVLSDTHDRRAAAAWALDELRRRGVTTVLHCGDVESPDLLELFRGLDAHLVFGNCDGDRDGLRAAAAAVGATLHGDWGCLELAGRKLAFLHGDDLGLRRDLEAAGQFDYLFHGHTHRAEDRQSGPTRVINPGALHRAHPKTFVVLDLADGRLQSIEVPA